MTLTQRDQSAIWHPFTQHQTSFLPCPIVRGKGSYLFDEKGKHYLDLISSWWVNLHGHSHPRIAEAIYQQAMTLEHVIFSGFTHEPAILLAEELLALLPNEMRKVFYSDNGSTAVEVALKMAYQYWLNQGETKRKRFIAFEKGYHGDTFGAMALGKKSGFFSPFEELLFHVEFFEYPATWQYDEAVEQKERMVLTKLQHYLAEFGSEIAGLIIEPLIQGSGGMRMCRPQFLQEIEILCKAHQVLIIYDEVMTGFGRTGDIFACTKARTVPDIICLAKGLTGGFLPLSATVCHEKIYNAFLDEKFAKAFAHGHSFTANPLGCAAALASLSLLKNPETQTQIKMIEKVHQEMFAIMADKWPVENLRYCGTVSAFDLKWATEYSSSLSIKLRNCFAERGLLVRPLGNVIYFLPPYCITKDELQHAYGIVLEEIEGIIA